MATGCRVAVVGGGISGLVCGVRLRQLGLHNVTVFDTGRQAVGGRCSSRDVNIGGAIHTFDHSAQYFTTSNVTFAKIVSFLYYRGAVRIWNGPVGHIRNGKFTESTEQAFIGSGGMRAIPKYLSSLVDVEQSVWIGNVIWEESCHKWHVDKYGYFDYLVIAHNGKCADKLMSNSGASAIHKLLQVRFSDRLNPRDPRMQLCSVWCLMLAFDRSLGLNYQGAHVETDSDISWICNNTKKLATDSKVKSSKVECWTIFSTRQFGTANKVPQENIPPKKEKEVTERLLEAFFRVTKLQGRGLKPCFTRVQLWGAAVPMNTFDCKDGCIFDASKNVGICGDWLVNPSIEGAAVSGHHLAERIVKHIQGDKVNGSSTTLEPKYIPNSGQPIGSFPYKQGMTFTPKSP